jgi:outer membrane receptor protein involved in Fe transport
VRAFLAGIAGHVDRGGSVVLQVRGLAQVGQLEVWLRDPSAPSFEVTESRTYGDLRALARLEITAGAA